MSETKNLNSPTKNLGPINQIMNKLDSNSNTNRIERLQYKLQSFEFKVGFNEVDQLKG